MKGSLAMAFLLFACSPSKPAPPPVAPAVQSAPVSRVIFPDNFAISVEIAADDPTREQGLMFRDHLADDKGMIFLFAKKDVYPFWMKNTLIPLDMVWIDEAKKVVTIARDVPPCKADPCPSYPANGPAPARYVLETAAGVTAKHHLEVGNTVRMEGLDNVAAR